MFKRLFLALLVLLVLLTGCDVVKTENDRQLFSTATELQQQINNKEWDQAFTKANDLQSQYQERKWKLQFLGELEDYKRIESEILTLKEAIKQKEELESNIAISQILHRLQTIYRL